MLKTRSLYDTDFNSWVEHQVAALRSQQLQALDLPNLIEEIEDLARRDKKALRSYLRLLLLHLLKWQFQPSQRSPSWSASIANARIEIEDILADSPSLKDYLPQVFDKAYANARTLAAKETGLAITVFPESSPYTLLQVLEDSFLPTD
jgi:hypothetical protein